MKKTNIYLISGLLVTAGVIVYLITINKSDKKTEGNGKDNKAKKILFVGDSNTFANFSYADQLKKMFPDLVIKKIAKNGANTNWMRQELDKELINNEYDYVSILAGSNDIYGGLSMNTTKNNLDYMYKLSHDKGSKVLAITPPNKNFYTKKTEQNQRELSELVGWIRNNRNKDYFIDFYDMTNDKSLFSANDGYLHPQSKAHNNLMREVKDKLNIHLKTA